MGRWIIIVGLVLVAMGTVLHIAPGLLGWFGKLPGDIHIKNGHGRVFIPITSMLVASLVLTVLLNLIRR